MVNGKTLVLCEGYTFYRKNPRHKKKWFCTNFPSCKAYIKMIDNYNMVITEMLTEHNHRKKVLHQTSDGRYARIKTSDLHVTNKYISGIDSQNVTMNSVPHSEPPCVENLIGFTII